MQVIIEDGSAASVPTSLAAAIVALASSEIISKQVRRWFLLLLL
jgi:hypothetical protein